ncbi:hypothetical protein NIES2111_04450 [Nostoc sp. NIES-2111]|nr:hypothetical protein NIES2111_04450 [Nostoc sp. NIES-2111]
MAYLLLFILCDSMPLYFKITTDTEIKRTYLKKEESLSASPQYYVSTK